MELEAIRSRTARAFGVASVRGASLVARALATTSSESRMARAAVPVATVNDREALVIERIYRDYLAGADRRRSRTSSTMRACRHHPAGGAAADRGRERHPHDPSQPALSRRVRPRPIKKVRQGGGSLRVKADPSEVLVIDLPEWAHRR